MAVKLKIYPRKKKGGRKGGKKRSVPQAVKSSPSDQATCTEIVEIPNLSPNTVYNTAFRIDAATEDNIASSQRFMRAIILASQYKFYRCSKVEYEWLPAYNTFQDGNGTSVPYLYCVMNRNGEELPVGPYDNAMLQRMGSSPIKMTKAITKAYKPNTLVGTASQHDIVPATNPTGIPGGNIKWTFTPKYDEWQSTEFLQATPEQASAGGNTMASAGFGPATYYGHWFYIKQDADAVPSAEVADLLVKVHWEFKEPRSLNDTRQGKMTDIAQLFPTQTPP